MNNSGAQIRYGGDRAFYRKDTDHVQLPPREAFADAPGFYGTAMHELIHWTGGEGGPATSAELAYPQDVAVDSAGNLYIAEQYGARVSKVSAATGIMTLFAGKGGWAYDGDGGPAINADLSYPMGVAVDNSGNVYIADQSNNVIRMVNTSGTISTVVGNGYNALTGSGGYSGDGGPATSAELYNPSGVAVDSSGNIYVADTKNYRLRKVTASTGIITTIDEHNGHLDEREAMLTCPLQWNLGSGLQHAPIIRSKG